MDRRKLYRNQMIVQSVLLGAAVILMLLDSCGVF